MFEKRKALSMSRLSRLPPICAAMVVLIAGSAAFAESKIGGVSQQEYRGATGAPSGGAASPLYFANGVYSGETVTTPDAGSTVLTFQDTTELRVGGSSTVVLDHFVYDPGSRTGDAAINFSKGIFRFVTGDIQNKSNVKLTTPTTSLTIRGTNFKVVVNDAGTIVAVTKGHVELKPCGGTAETRLLGPGEAAAVSTACTVKAVALSDVPTDPGTDGGGLGDGTRGNEGSPSGGGGGSSHDGGNLR
jgi:hypothetical protein